MNADSLAGDAGIAGLALFGKTALALVLVVGLIFLCSYLLKRLQLQRRVSGGHLRLISSLAVGQRERLVIVEVDGKWLVLGVGGGRVSKLHDFAAPPPQATPPREPAPGFAGLLRRAHQEQRG